MNLKEYAVENDMSLSEAKKLTGLTHWKQEVPESCDEISEIQEANEIPSITAPKDEKKVREAQIKATQLRQYLGEKSIEYLEFVSAYRDVIPAEYNRAKEMIDIYL